MFKYRIISFICLLAILAGIIYLCNYNLPAGLMVLTAVFAFSGGMVSLELGRMLEKAGVPCFPGIFGAVTIFLLLGSAWIKDIGINVLFLPYLFLLPLLFLREKRAVYLKKIMSGAGLVTAGIMIAGPLLILANYPSELWYFIFMVLVTKSMDTGGYVFGMLSSRLMKGGNHKIIPSISPGKSWEGTIGGIIFTVAVAMIFGRYDVLHRSEIFYLVSGLLLALGSFAGDLTESAIKRECQVKDSGAILPGMGGFFDLFDSFIYNGVIFIVLMSFVS